MAVWIAHDQLSQVITGNRAAYELVRLPPQSNVSFSASEDQRPSHFKIYQHGVELPPNDLPIQIAAASGVEIRDFEQDLVFDDGTVVHELGHVMPLFDEQGRPRGAVAAFLDITERKQTEKALQASEERFRSMFEKHNAIMLLIEPDSGRIIDANQSAQNFYGYPIEKMKAMQIQDINVLNPVEVAERRRQAKHESLNFFVFPHRLANGEIRTVEVHSSPIAIHDQPILFSIIHDITERKQAEEALAASEAKYRLLLENMREAFSLYEIITDDTGQAIDFRILEANAAYERHTGLKPQEVIGKTGREVMPQIDQRQIDLYAEVALTGEPLTLEYYSKIFGRHFRVVAFRPQPGRFASIVEDITERKEAEQALQRAERLCREPHSNRECALCAIRSRR